MYEGECDQRLKAMIIIEELKMEGRRMRTVANAVNVLVGEDAVLVVVGPVTSLLNESGRKAVGIGLVVGQLRVDVIVNLGERDRESIAETRKQWLPTFH